MPGWRWASSKSLFAATAAFVSTPVIYGRLQGNESEQQEQEKMSIISKVQRQENLVERIAKARTVVDRYMTIYGIPGLSVAVSVDGRKIYAEGFGYADVETGAKCTEDTVMRIASISKPFTATIAAKLFEAGKLDLDKDILEYVKSDFPRKKWNGKEVTITMKQLLSHTSGIRHYKKPENQEEKGKEKKPVNGKKLLEEQTTEKKNSSDAEYEEFFSNVEYKNVIEALRMFKDDDLLAEPGTKFNYTTHGLTLASAVIEKCAGEDFPLLIRKLCFELGLRNTQVDVNSKIISNRAKYYQRDGKHVLLNCPEVNNSYKWAGGGLLSNVHDLLIFGNAILFSSQSPSKDSLLSQSTIKEFWKPIIDGGGKIRVALGWMVVDAEDKVSMEGARSTGGFVYHTGGAVGASSVLFLRPKLDCKKASNNPEGTCVVILCNLQDVSVLQLAHELEEIFHN